MWMPTHVQVTVQRASGLLIKGKNGTNDCLVTIALGKTKYQTSIKEKAEPSVDWHEECELPIPDQGNKAEIVLTVLHRNFMSVDEFLGRVVIPLNSLDIYERPKNKWYPLQSKPGKENKKKDRGQLEVKIRFSVKSGSLDDLSKKEKHKSSLGHLSQVAQSVGSSLLSLGNLEKQKGIKKFAKSIGTKMHLKGKKKHSDSDDSYSVGSVSNLQKHSKFDKSNTLQTEEDADPGVISEDEDDFMFEDLSHKSSASSISQTNQSGSVMFTTADSSTPDMPKKKNSPSISITPITEVRQDEWESKLFGRQSRNKNGPTGLKTISSLNNSNERTFNTSNFNDRTFSSNNTNDRFILRGDVDTPAPVTNVSNELLQKFKGKTREELILTVCQLQQDLDINKKRLKDLEDYLDDLLLRVMETTPRILQNPYVSCKIARL